MVEKKEVPIKFRATKVGEWGKVVIPVSVRTILKLEKGDKVDWFLIDGRIFIKKAEQGAKPIEKRF